MFLVASARHTVRFDELDDADHHLLRAAYETPSYDHDEYQEQDDMSLGKLDLLKDGLWAVKAKIKELKAFNKAMAANFLATKLKVKELLANSIPLKKHHHADKKPSYNYQVGRFVPGYRLSSPPSSILRYICTNLFLNYNSPKFNQLLNYRLGH